MSNTYESLKITETEISEIKTKASNDGIYKELSDSIAPSLFGFDELKEAVLLQLFGENINMLVVGDPSVGKTALLDSVSNAAPGGKYISWGEVAANENITYGFGDSFSARIDKKLWNSFSIIAFDGIEKMSSLSHAEIHDVVEKGNSKLLASANPKFSRFDPYIPIGMQISLTDSMMSMFDLKFVIRDIPQKINDRKLADHILNLKYRNSKNNDTSFIKKYISYAKNNCSPKLTEEAGNLLRDFYIKAREHSIPVSISLRQFEGMIKLAEASARVQLQDTVRKSDAERAIRLMEFSINCVGFDPNTGKIDIDIANGRFSNSDRKVINRVVELVKKNADSNGKVPLSSIEEALFEEGYSHGDDILEMMKAKGDLNEISPGYVKLIKVE